jgi:hypothetical protein
VYTALIQLTAEVEGFEINKKLFSLIEVIATFVVISLLLVLSSRIAPSILEKFNKTEAISNLNIVAQNQFNYASKSGFYIIDSDDFSKLDLSGDLTLTNLNSNNHSTISLDVSEDGSLVMAALANDNKCYAIFLKNPIDFEGIINIPYQSNIVCSAKSMREFL